MGPFQRKQITRQIADEALLRSLHSAGGGITQLTGQVTAGPGSGSQVATITPGMNGQVLTTSGGITVWASPAASGINQLTGDVLAGPGTGSQATTVVNLTGSGGLVTVPTASLAFGTDPALTGLIQVPNATTAVSSRNAANNGDIACVTTDSTNQLYLGGNASAVQLPTNIFVNAVGAVILQSSSGDVLETTSSQITAFVALFGFSAAVSSPVIGQAAAAGVDGQALGIQAQSVASGVGNGGTLQLAGGSEFGGGTNGSVQLIFGGLGGNVIAEVDGNGFTLGQTNFALAATGTTTLTAAQYQWPVLIANTILQTGAQTLVFPNAAGLWIVDLTNVTGAGDTLTFQSGSATAVITLGAGPISTDGGMYFVKTTGSNGIVIK